MRNDAKAELSMLGKRADHLGGAGLAQRHAQAAARKSAMEETIKRSLRASEAADQDIQVLEKRLAAKRKGASPEKLRAAQAHHDRVAALNEAQQALATCAWEDKARHRSEVDRLRALIDKGAHTGDVSASGMQSDWRFIQELMWLEHEIEVKREALAVLVARTKAELDHAQKRYREIDAELAKAESAPFFASQGGDR